MPMAMVTRPAPVDSIVELLRALVRIPSRAGEDDLDPICRCVETWLHSRGIAFRLFKGRHGERLGLYAEIQGRVEGPWTVLNATLDTAGFGSPEVWAYPPTEARTVDGWLHGRGSADSKAAVAVFSHLLAELHGTPAFSGRIGVLFDCDEHSGNFGGAHAFFDHPHNEAGQPSRPDGVLIGYPGIERIVNGSRGFIRCNLRVHGIAAHSGATRSRGVNAISRALDIARRLESIPLPAPTGTFPLPPQLTITRIAGGAPSFTQVPDSCDLGLDFRLTPGFGEEAVQLAVEAIVDEADLDRGAAAPTDIAWIRGWPAYQVPPSHPIAKALRDAARSELNADVPTAVVGPSNIGNYLATLGIPALCGFGVRCEGIHAANERIDLDSIEPVYRIYRRALMQLHAAG